MNFELIKYQFSKKKYLDHYLNFSNIFNIIYIYTHMLVIVQK